MITTILSGCALENPLDGEICMDEEHPVLSKVLIDKNTWCTRENCPSSDHCCSDISMDSDLRKQVSQAFEYNMCPKNSDISACLKKYDEYYCSKGCPPDQKAFHIASCKNGVAECMTDYANCDGDISNGCETKLSINHLLSCEDGILECQEGFADCNGIMSDGCETDLESTRVLSCKDGKITECYEEWGDCDGELDNGCEIPIESRKILACQDNAVLMCEDGYVDCNDDLTDGCEYDLDGQADSQPKNALSCTNKNVACKNGWNDCNQDYNDGCEINTQTHKDHCGECNHACKPEEFCNRGTCMEAQCNPNFILCQTEDGRVCIPQDLTHLESCGIELNDLTCTTGYQNCNAIAKDGCETYISGNDPDHCGGCEKVCDTNTIRHSLAVTCQSGKCTPVACQAGYKLSNNICVACSDGEYGANNTCTQCPAGTKSDSNYTTCTPCPAGYYSTKGASECTACSGNKVSTAGANTCVTCGNGTYANELHTTCIGCTNDSQCKTTSGTTQMKCESGVCKAASCSSGYYLSSLGCFPCAAGTYNANPTATSCTACQDGTISTVGQSKCTACIDGFYTADHKTCTACAAGTSTSSSNHKTCVACNTNQYSQSGTPCIDCPEGFYSNAGDATCFTCLSAENCPSAVGATAMKCEDHQCLIDQCSSSYHLYNNTCWSFHGNLISRSTNPSAHCVSTDYLCIKDYVHWTNQFCIPRGIPAFNFDYGQNVGISSSNPPTQIYIDGVILHTQNNTKIKEVYEGNIQTAIEQHFFNNNECMVDSIYTSSYVNINSSSNICSNYVRSFCIKTVDPKSHSTPYYYTVLLITSSNDSFDHLILWRRLED